MAFVIRLFNDLKIEYNGVDCTYIVAKSAKQRSIIAYLLTASTFSRTISDLYNEFYFQEKCHNPESALKTMMCRLRRQFAQAAPDIQDSLIVYENQAYSINANYIEYLDIQEFFKMCKHYNNIGNTNFCDITIENIQQIHLLYSGKFMKSLDYYYWIRETSDFYHNQYLVAIKNVLYYLCESKRFEVAVSLIKLVCALFPEDEDVQIMLLNVLYLAGKTNELKSQYIRICKRLKEQFGTKPSDAMHALYKQAIHAYSNGKVTRTLPVHDFRGYGGPLVCESTDLIQFYYMLDNIARRNSLNLFQCAINVTSVDAYELLKKVVQNTLRSGDIIFCISEQEILILLLVKQVKDGQIVISRIERAYRSISPPDWVIQCAETTMHDCVAKL